MNSEILFKEGRLGDALDAQLAVVKKDPSNTNARFFLAELLAFGGEWERVDRQLDSVVVQTTEKMAMLPMLFRQLVRAEVIREQVFNEGRAPELVVKLDEVSKLQLELCLAMRLGHDADLNLLIEKVQAARKPVNGVCDGKAFSILHDLDDRLGGVAEVLTASGKYFWLPWKDIQSVEFSKPERPIDLIWRKATISVIGGPDGEVYLPTRYPNPVSWTDEQKLGRTTDWVEHAGGLATGIGQRTLLIGDDGVPFLEIGQIQIESNPTEQELTLGTSDLP